MATSTDIVTLMENKTDTQETVTVLCRGCFDDFTITTAEYNQLTMKRYYCSDACIYADFL